MQKYKQQYKSKRFKSEATFQKWLSAKTVFEISFKDFGQDCLKWYIDDGGEVLHSNLQSSVWNGELVALSKLKRQQNIQVLNTKEQSYMTLDFVVKSIKKNKEGK